MIVLDFRKSFFLIFRLTLLVLTAQFCLSTASARDFSKRTAACNEKYQGMSDTMIVSKIRCYNEAMDGILQDKRDLEQLGKVIVELRGTFQEGTAREHDCGGFFSSHVERVRPAVSGGKCSDFWNASVHHQNEYYRLTCHVGFGELDETVATHSEGIVRSDNKYKQCFSNNIPGQVRDDFSITDRNSFIRAYNRIKTAYEKSRNSLEYEDLAITCNELLASIQKSKPELIAKHDLRCN